MSNLTMVGSILAMAMVFCTVSGHGLMTGPRCRGALETERSGVEDIATGTTIDYCPHCQNAGGTGMVKEAGPWTPYDPMSGSKRGGFGLCGDPVGGDDHMKSGKFANPASMPYVANYAPGSVANFEYDFTTNHNGYLEFYLCDVSGMPGKDISYTGFTDNCYYLERYPHPDCEAGTEKDCGPIDPAYPGRWVVPCRTSESDQIVGGSNGKMAYKIPNVQIQNGVIQSYWLTQNSCNSPDGFMDNYNYPAAWGNCPGDGGSVGGKPNHVPCGDGGRFPEEFWNCADVQVLPGGSGSPPKVTIAPSTGATTVAPKTTEGSEAMTTSVPAATTRAPITDTKTTAPVAVTEDDVKDPVNGKCKDNWRTCAPSKDSCCDDGYVCAPYFGSSPMCVPRDDVADNVVVETTTATPATTRSTASSETSMMTTAMDEPVTMTTAAGSTQVSSTNKSKESEGTGKCVEDWEACSSGDECCSDGFTCGSFWGSFEMCFPSRFGKSKTYY